jgi:O-acetylhomoserine/O-acetylserine sulfhydrylase-like pyridoxal-dependent enzyme
MLKPPLHVRAMQDAKPKYNQGVATSTAIISYNASPNDPHRPTSMPIYQSSTFIQPAADEFQEYDYTRSGNPTRSALETLVAGMEGAHAAFAFTSGMAALSNMTRLLQAGDEILCNADIYGGMYRILSKVAVRQGIKVRFIPLWYNFSKSSSQSKFNRALTFENLCQGSREGQSCPDPPDQDGPRRESFQPSHDGL